MTFVVGNSVVEFGRSFLYFCLFGMEGTFSFSSGQPFWNFSRDSSLDGTETQAFGLTLHSNRVS